MNQYEAMFVFDPTFGSSLEKCETEIGRLMERANAEIIISRKWDERRLAYRINGRKRGVYMLTYFNAPPEKIVSLERDATLSPDILRLLVLRAEGLSRESMERAYTAWRESPESSGESGDFDTPRESEPTDAPRAAVREPEPQPVTVEAPSEPATPDVAPADAPEEPGTSD